MNHPVEAQVESLVLPTYPEPPPVDYPMFAENRVHQRSSGNPYPNQVVMDVEHSRKEDKSYTAIRLENEYLRVVILPELGGRLYSAYDKVNKYDFFYKQHVIKPALIGHLGSWVSGGVEFNWPSHHRPSTFMPCDYHIQQEPDGAVTVWMSEHEPLDRMKGMVGIRLAPGSSLLETRMRVYNRGPLRRSFLWWENAAVPVNQDYRLFFPPDVSYVQFHYRKDITTFPIAQGQYNGIPMGEGTDIRYHKNTRQPTSYFSAASAYDFFGGYDEGKKAGVVHVASRHTAPGKKMFTWAYNQLSQSWERALTDTDGAYAELMAGSYSDNQPDFAWLEPYETKEFTQAWYPIGPMGVPDCATLHAAACLGGDSVCIQATRVLADAVVRIDGREFSVNLKPGEPARIAVKNAAHVVLTDSRGQVLLQYGKEAVPPLAMPDPLPGNPSLEQLSTAQDYYLAGVHVQQYRDPAAWPDGYWQPGLLRDPEHLPTLTALAALRYEKGRYLEARNLLERAWHVASRWNFHPESGILPYLQGLTERALGETEKAYGLFCRALWNRDVMPQALIMLAALDGKKKDYAAMAGHAAQALNCDWRCGRAAALYAIALVRLGNAGQAAGLLQKHLAKDPLDHALRWLQYDLLGGGGEDFYAKLHSDPAQTCLDLFWELVECGEDASALRLLAGLKAPTAMTAYAAAMVRGEMPDSIPKNFGRTYPFRREEETALRFRLAHAPGDVTALWGLGALLYDKRRYQEAARAWEQALALDPGCVQALRGLAIACFSHLNRKEETLPLLMRALEAAPQDTQLLFEAAYVMTRLNRDPLEKLQFLAAHPAGRLRDDLVLEWAQAENLAGRHAQALERLLSHRFTPCEGGEHAVAEQYMFAHYALGRQAFKLRQYQQALEHFQAAQVLTPSLGAGLWNEVLKTPHRFHQAQCLQALGKPDQAQAIFRELAGQKQDYFSDMHLPELPCWQAACLACLGHPEMGRQLAARHLARYEQAAQQTDPGFYRTTPFFLCYVDDPVVLRQAASCYQKAMAHWAVGDGERAAPLFAKAHAQDPGHLYAALMAGAI